jgi:hypothetical protein
MCFLSSLEYIIIARTIWRVLEQHLIRLALSLAFRKEGRSMASNRAMIPMTTSNSTSVNPRLRRMMCRLSPPETRSEQSKI